MSPAAPVRWSPLSRRMSAAPSVSTRPMPCSIRRARSRPNCISPKALFAAAGLPQPTVARFQVVYAIDQLVVKSFPANDDRAALRRMIAELVACDAMDVGSRADEGLFVYPTVVLTATKPSA